LGNYLKGPATVACVVTTIVAAVTLVSLVVPLHETLTIGLLELVRVAVPPVVAVVAMSVAIKVRTLRIVILPSLRIIRAGVQAILITLLTAALSVGLGLLQWHIVLPGSQPNVSLGKDLRSQFKLLLWFTWPAWPLALWTLWRWRRQLTARHVALPLWFALVKHNGGNRRVALSIVS